MTKSEHLQWLHDRIINVYGENKNVDFLHKFREIIEDFNKTESIIAQQDSIIGSQSRKISYLEDSEFKRNQWLRDAKKEAGYDDSISFDIVWSETLKKAQS
jgi:hypothetical protein